MCCHLASSGLPVLEGSVWSRSAWEGTPVRKGARGHLSAQVSTFRFCARSGMGEGMPASAPLDPSLPGCPWSSSPLQALLSLDPWPRGLQNVALPLPPCVLLPGPADGSLHRAPAPTPASLQVPPARGSAWSFCRPRKPPRASC